MEPYFPKISYMSSEVILKGKFLSKPNIPFQDTQTKKTNNNEKLYTNQTRIASKQETSNTL